MPHAIRHRLRRLSLPFAIGVAVIFAVLAARYYAAYVAERGASHNAGKVGAFYQRIISIGCVPPEAFAAAADRFGWTVSEEVGEAYPSPVQLDRQAIARAFFVGTHGDLFGKEDGFHEYFDSHGCLLPY